ncbi:DUF2799 domain-containing protein [Polycladidibacter stylochi]|uniref:DUF2799 domain-containing protein n=1 Tax=Polycladidibacter stylochi TaxID=1807766 RepID=UPI000831CBE9|nr:DUF2799 domain-containing protein [Pseudovibrio stylochi]
MLKYVVCLTAVALSLGGCASLSKDQCLQGDWKGIGVLDGKEGRPETRIEEHQKACAKYKVIPDRAAYNSGRKEGLKTYCSVSSGFSQGRADKRYYQVCSGRAASLFLDGYNLGQTLRQAEDANDDAEREVSRIKDRINRLQDEVSETSCHDAKKPKECRKDRRKKESRISELRLDLVIAYADLHRSESRLNSTRSQVYSQMQLMDPNYVRPTVIYR